MQEWQIVIPFISPTQNLVDCLRSMGDLPVPLLIVDNSPDSVTRNMELHPNIEVSYHPENLGVPASWNMGLRKGAKWTMVLSASVRFGGRFPDFIEGCTKRASAYGLSSRMAMHLWVWGRTAIEEIGYYDEHYFPSYYDDNDIWRRSILAGQTGCGESEFPYFHPSYLTDVGNAVALKSGTFTVDFQKNLNFYKAKWGDEPTKETYSHPYNKSYLPLSYIGDPPND